MAFNAKGQSFYSNLKNYPFLLLGSPSGGDVIFFQKKRTPAGDRQKKLHGTGRPACKLSQLKF
jgi:hypothetical protein